MKNIKFLLLLIMISSLAAPNGDMTAKEAQEKKRILVVGSYHKDYLWSQETHRGFSDAMLKFGYFDTKDQVAEFTRNDDVETSKAVLKRLWMDAKIKSSKAAKEEISLEIYKIAGDFKPDLIFLGDDDAAEYIGRQFLDSDVPVVFWGLNNTPIKYGLVDSMGKPGHNVTGVYESGYYIESLQLLKRLVPGAKSFAVLSDETTTGRSHFKQIEYLARKGALPLALVETISTNDYEIWKKRALELQSKVDAFYVVAYAGLKNKADNYVPNEEVARWYLNNIKIPEASRGHFVRHGMLCATYDSGYNQGAEAVAIAQDILSRNANPSIYPPRAPKRGALMVNKQRAAMLGIVLTEKMGIEEYVEKASALASGNNEKEPR